MGHTHALWMVGAVLEIVGRLNPVLQATLLRVFAFLQLFGGYLQLPTSYL